MRKQRIMSIRKTPLMLLLTLLLLGSVGGCEASTGANTTPQPGDGQVAPSMITSQTPAIPGEVVKRSYTNQAGTRTYYLYTPPQGGVGRPLMIWLHGCGGPGPMQAGHALAKIAEQMNFVLAYPIEPASANPGQCWNWYLPRDQHRGAGEPSIIAGITTSLIKEFHSDTSRVYIGGYSAGGAMTSVMAADYPDLYAAIAPSAGAPYGFDPTGKMAYDEMGQRARIVPAFLLQGVLDEISLYPIGRTNLLQWLGTDDFADDGVNNNSVSRLPSKIAPQVLNTDPPLPVVVEDYDKGSCHLARFLTSPYDHLINGLLFYADNGIALQQMMMNFLFEHRMGDKNCG